jgi:hypothetical protein
MYWLNFFYFCLIGPLLANNNFQKKPWVKVATTHKKLGNQQTMINAIDLYFKSFNNGYRLFLMQNNKKSWSKILSPWGKLEYKYEKKLNPITPDEPMENKTLSLIVFRKWHPLSWCFKIYKLIKKNQEYYKYLSYKKTIKEKKNKILERLRWEFSQQNKIYEEENHQYQMEINGKSLNGINFDQRWLAQKRQLKLNNNYQLRNHQRTVANHQNTINTFTDGLMGTKGFLFKFKSYNTLLNEHTFSPSFFYFKILDFISFSWSWNYTKEDDFLSKMLKKKTEFKWENKFSVDFNSDNIEKIKDIAQSRWKRIIHKREKVIYIAKDKLRQEAYLKRTNNFNLIQEYRKDSLIILKGYEELFKFKYGDKIYNSRFFFEFLLNLNNHGANYIRYNQKFIEFLWITALKNPKTIIVNKR